MVVSREFDEIYNELLTAHLNKSGKNAGLLLQIVYTAVAVISWGLYKKLQWLADQVFPDTASSEWVEKHAGIRGVSITDKTTDEILDDVIEDIQYPRAGGNSADWERWVKEVSYTHDAGGSGEWTETVSDVVIDEGARGGGTVNVVVTSNRTESGYEEIPTTELLTAIETYLETKRPVGIWDYQVYAAGHDTQAVTLAIAADNYTYVAAQVESAIEAYLMSILPGGDLVLSQIVSVAMVAGATDVGVSLPVGNVSPDNGPDSYDRIWPGTITVSEM